MAVGCVRVQIGLTETKLYEDTLVRWLGDPEGRSLLRYYISYYDSKYTKSMIFCLLPYRTIILRLWGNDATCGIGEAALRPVWAL
jgi:hypothetical protein